MPKPQQKNIAKRETNMKHKNNTIVSLCHHVASSFRFVFKRDCLEHRFVQLDLSKAGRRHLKGPHSWTLLRVGLKYLDPCHLLRVWNIYETPRDFSCPAFNSLRGYPFSVLFLCDVPSPLFHNHMLSWMRTNRMSVREHLWSKDTWRMQRDYCKVKRCDSERCNLQHEDIGNIVVFYLVTPLYGCVDGPRSAMLPREQRHDAMSQTCETNLLLRSGTVMILAFLNGPFKAAAYMPCDAASFLRWSWVILEVCGLWRWRF